MRLCGESGGIALPICTLLSHGGGATSPWLPFCIDPPAGWPRVDVLIRTYGASVNALIVRENTNAVCEAFEALQCISTSQDLELLSCYISFPPLLIVHLPPVDLLCPSQPRELGFWYPTMWFKNQHGEVF